MQEKGWINGSDGREPRNNNPLEQVDVKGGRKRNGERDRLRRGGTDERGKEKKRKRERSTSCSAPRPLMRCHEDLWTARSLYANP